MTLDDIAVTRALLAHAREQGWEYGTEAFPIEGRHEWELFEPKDGPRRIYKGAVFVDSEKIVADGQCGVVTLELPTSAQQVADCLAAVGLVPVELTSGWKAACKT